jgi:hypothetical protein
MKYRVGMKEGFSWTYHEMWHDGKHLKVYSKAKAPTFGRKMATIIADQLNHNVAGPWQLVKA